MDFGALKVQPRRIPMANKDKSGPQASSTAAGAQAGKGPKDRKDTGNPKPNAHLEHQDRHGTGEGATGMQPGAGRPRGR
jgi:hypothetical protein